MKPQQLQLKYTNTLTATHQWGVSGQYIPGHVQTLYYRSSRSANIAARELYRRPWNYGRTNYPSIIAPPMSDL